LAGRLDIRGQLLLAVVSTRGGHLGAQLLPALSCPLFSLFDLVEAMQDDGQ
jgi:hypothetical protein